MNSNNYINTVKNIIIKTLPDAAIYAFGSRISGNAGKFSDLDIALDYHKLIPLDKLAVIKEDFSESDLEFKIDIIDLYRVPENVKKNIFLHAQVIS